MFDGLTIGLASLKIFDCVKDQVSEINEPDALDLFYLCLFLFFCSYLFFVKLLKIPA